MNSKDLLDLHESFSSIINEQVTSTTHDFKRGVDKAPSAPTLPPSPESKKTNQLPKRTAANAANVRYYKDDVDLFDLIKSHLIDEGFAETEEAAHSIMASMSEGWKQCIVEGPALQNTIRTLETRRDNMDKKQSGSSNRAVGGGSQSVGGALYKAYGRLKGV